MALDFNSFSFNRATVSGAVEDEAEPRAKFGAASHPLRKSRKHLGSIIYRF